MGKRELLIVAVFAAIGLAIFRTVSPADGAPRNGFSIGSLIGQWRNRHMSMPAHATVTTTGRLAVAPALGALRLSGLATVEVVGEARDDIAWELRAEANAPDEPAARQAAEQTTLRADDLGPVMAISVRAPGTAPQASTLTLRVPARLAIRVESARRTRVTGVSAVRLDNLVGDADVSAVDGLVDGGHRNGNLAIDDVERVRLTLVGSNAVLRAVRGETIINARDGNTRIDNQQGPALVEVNGQALTVVEPEAPIRASGIGGEIVIERPRAAVDIDARRLHVGLALDRAVPVTVFSTDVRLDLTLDAGLPIRLDIATDDGTIDASHIGLAAEVRDGANHLVHAFGDEARVAIRDHRSSIVITSGK